MLPTRACHAVAVVSIMSSSVSNNVLPKAVNNAAEAVGITSGESLVAFTLGFSAAQQTAAQAVLDGSTLTYFAVAARAETARLMLNLSGVKFNDERVPFQQWGELKPKTPWGSLPYLTLADGTVVGQSNAINRFVAKLTGFYPAEPLATAFVDQLLDGASELFPTAMKVGAGLEKAEKEAARAAACTGDGAIAALLRRIDGMIAQHGSGGHAVGATLTLADVFLFSMLTAFVSGTFDGVPADALAAFPHVEGVRRTVASHPGVKAYYAGRTDAGSQCVASRARVSIAVAMVVGARVVVVGVLAAQ